MVPLAQFIVHAGEWCDDVQHLWRLLGGQILIVLSLNDLSQDFVQFSACVGLGQSSKVEFKEVNATHIVATNNPKLESMLLSIRWYSNVSDSKFAGRSNVRELLGMTGGWPRVMLKTLPWDFWLVAVARTVALLDLLTCQRSCTCTRFVSASPFLEGGMLVRLAENAGRCGWLHSPTLSGLCSSVWTFA